VTTATSTTAANKRKSWNQAYYAKKKLCLLNFEPNAAATAIANTTAIAATAAATTVATTDSAPAMVAITGRLSIIADVAAAADPWSLNAKELN
jgi:hypothetical protein